MELRGITFLVTKDKRGCLYLQKKIGEANPEEIEMFFELKDQFRKLMGEHVNRLVAKIATNALVLCESRFGNYVVQFILAMKEPYVQHAKAHIFAQLAGNYVSLSFNKYSSNVVEKCLKKAGEDQAEDYKGGMQYMVQRHEP
ncbi:pumilio homolog 12-like, partial [Camellia sinensis]|uniref:pumilio homolog 12-like n=1 Tax=Camellia sinensis TaxID=4442 RepID=UPI0010356B27